MTTEYDAIVVGARCAGSPTAMLLAQRGYRVLLVDRATFPSDTVSTLIINPPGVAALQRWGLLDAVVATGCPPIKRYSFDFGPVVIAGTPRAGDGTSTAYAPRRTVLDKILLDGAGGRTVVERARVVVGANGANSIVARSVRAHRYHEKPVLETAFYTFWSDLPVDGVETVIRGDRGYAAIPTNDGLTLVLAGCPQAQARDFRHDIETNYLAAIDRAPDFAERLRTATRQDRFHAGGVPNFFRVPYGPGWALVGDAGYTKDPITAQGISDAFTSAERCVTALDEAFTRQRSYDEAMAAYQRARDEHALPIYDFTTQMATLEPPPPEMQQLFAAIAEDQAAMDGFVSVMTGTATPTEFFAPENVGRILTRAATDAVA